jgi:Holliday junction resolvase-like predicted endonuclease
VVAKRGRTLLFGEVKARTSVDLGLDAVTPQAAKRIERSASVFLARNPDLAGCLQTYDLFVQIGRWRVAWFRNVL